MTGKQKAMVRERIKDPKATNAEIIKRAGYEVKGTGNQATNTASQIYLENMKRPEIAKALNDVVDEVEEVLITNVRQFKDSEKQWQRQLSNDNSKWIHDKIKGTATKKIQTTSTKLTISLTGNKD